MIEIKYITKTDELPVEWDDIAGNYFRQIKFLKHAERYNPCNQRYYLCLENKKLNAAAIVYSLQLDLLTFIRLKSPLRMNIVGVPCSVSTQGIFGNEPGIKILKKYIFKNEKGLTLALNLDHKPTGNYATGKTLPTIVMNNRFESWNDYTGSLRSGYRRRLKHINYNENGITFKKIQCHEFTEEMYCLYLEVYKKSRDKLEKLSFSFFKNLPDDFNLLVCFLKNKVIGWHITLYNNEIFYFFLGGVYYNLNKDYNTYFRLLSSIVKEGIERKSKIIELGQTAEIPKMRLGGEPVNLFMEAHHTNVFINKLLKWFSFLLEYKKTIVKHHSFKPGGE